jgi:hypothetical protein
MAPPPPVAQPSEQTPMEMAPLACEVESSANIPPRCEFVKPPTKEPRRAKSSGAPKSTTIRTSTLILARTTSPYEIRVKEPRVMELTHPRVTSEMTIKTPRGPSTAPGP